MDVQIYDSEIQELITHIIANRNSRKRGYLKDCKILLNYAKAMGDEALLGFCYYYLGRSYYYSTDSLKKAMQTIKKALHYAQITQDYEILSRIYNILGIDASNRGLEELALEYYMMGRRYSFQCNDIELQSILEYNMGYSYMEMGDVEGSLKFFMRAYRLCKNCGTKNNTAIYIRYLICCVVGILYAYLKKENRVKKVFAELEKIETQYGNRIPEAFEEPLNYIFRITYYEMIGDKSMLSRMQTEFKNQLGSEEVAADCIDDLIRYCETLAFHGHLALAEEFIQLTEKSVQAADVPYLNMNYYRMLVSFYDKKKDEAKKQEAVKAYFENSQKQIADRKKAFSFYSQMIETVEKIRLDNIRLAKEARTDPLTKLPNRLDMSEVGSDWFERAQTEGAAFGVEIFDIDKFKEYNDTFGHQIGDVCLEEIGRVLWKFSNENSENIYVGRYGGDEFLVYYYNMTDSQILELAKRLQKEFKKICVKTGGKDISGISVSQGIRNTVPHSDNKMWDFMYSADSALYEVKKRKRGDILIIHRAFLSDASLADSVVPE